MPEPAAGTAASTNIKAEIKTSSRASSGGGPDAARVLVVLALALTALSYLNTIWFKFVYDDLPQIINNPRVHSLAHVPRLFVEHVWSQFGGQPGNYYRPLFEVWLAINYSIFGLNPAGWHAATIAVHLAVVAMVYVLAQRIATDRLTAAIATVVFALHPTHIETVAWVSGIPDALLAIFVIGSMLAYIRSRRAEGEAGTGAAAAGYRALSVFTYGLALLCKETGIMLPVVLFAYDRLLVARGATKDTWAAVVRRYVPYAVMAVVYLVVRHWILGELGYAEPKPWADVLLTAPSFLWFYVRELIWPVGLSVFHDTPLVHTPGLTNFVLPLAGVAAFVAAAIYGSRRWREVSFGTWWLAAFMVPPMAGIYTFVAEDLVHDRYLYLPSIGFAIAAAWAIRQVESSDRELFGAPLAPVAVTLALAVVMAVGTTVQNVYWQNDLVLYVHAVKTAPRNVLAINHLANEMYKRHRPAEALALYRQSAEIKPQSWATHFALGITQYELGHYADAQKELETAIPLLPGNTDEYYYLALAHMQQGHYGEAEPYFRKTLEMYASKPGAHYGLSISLEKQGKLTAAQDEMRAEWKINPSPQVKRELERMEASQPPHQ